MMTSAGGAEGLAAGLPAIVGLAACLYMLLLISTSMW